MKLSDLLDAIKANPEVEAPEGLTAAAADAIVVEALDAWTASKAAGTPDLAVVTAAKKAKGWSDAMKAKACALDEADAAMASLTPATAATDEKTDKGADEKPATAAVDEAAKTAAAKTTLDGIGDTAPPADQTPRVAGYVASGAKPHVASMGSPLEDKTLGQLIGEVATGLAEGQQAMVASLTYIHPAAPRLGGDSPMANTELLWSGSNALRTRQAQAKVAAANAGAGFCGMPQYLETVSNRGTAERPLTGGAALRTFPITGRLIKHYRRSALSTVSAGVKIWQATDQALVDPDVTSTWKPAVDLSCNGTEITVTPYMVWAGARFDSFQEMARPDRVSELTTLVQRQTSRVAETYAWDQIITLGGTIGTAVAPLAPGMADLAGLREVIASVMAHYGYDNRDPQQGWNAIFQYGFDMAIATALGNRAFGMEETRRRGQDEINGMLADLGMGSGVFMLDDHTGAPARPTLPAAGAQAANTTVPVLSSRVWTVTLYDKASVFHGAKGVYAANVYREGDYRRQNRALFSLEDMEAIGRDGENPPITLKIKLGLSGARAAQVTYNVADADLS